MAGNVYVFNFNMEALNLAVNNGQQGTIPGWSSGYQPGSQAVPRAPAAGPGQFGNGSNQLMLVWPSGGPATAQIGIDGNIAPLFMDLLLLIERNQWQLVDSHATFIASGGMSGGGFGEEAVDGPANPAEH